jgi:AAA family ATP:ADP antiporter
MSEDPPSDPRRSALDRLLRLFGDVRAGEGPTVLLLMSNVFLLLLGYYICKTARDPLVLATGGVLGKSAAGAVQAVVLMGFIPLYSWFASRVDRMRLITGVLLFFALNLELFWLAALLRVPLLGAGFYVWVGIFNNAVVAQFWSYGNDLFDEETGKRLFPIVAIGATLGAPFGSKLAAWLFGAGVGAYSLLHVTAVVLVLCLALFWAVEAREGARRRATAPGRLAAGANGFLLLARSPYLRLISLLLLLLNLVNTTGGYVLDTMVTARVAAEQAADPAFDQEAWMGVFYGNYNFYVAVLTFLIQAFLVSRIVKVAGLAGVLLALPVLAFGLYGGALVFTTLGMLYLTKVAENATDYSVMNTARQMFWLVTSREEKYKAKQAADTFVVRVGDLVSFVFYYAATVWLSLGPRGLLAGIFVVIVLWLGTAFLLLREYRRLSAEQAVLAAA